MAASAEFTVNGSTVPPEVAVAALSTVTLALVSVTGVRSIAWSIVGNASESAVNPTITPAGSPIGATATFTMPSGGAQGYLVQCVINGGVDESGQAVTNYTKRALVGVNDSLGDVPFVVGETFERSATHGYTERLNNMSDALNNIEGGYIDPAFYGAVGNGIASDNAALLLAVTAGIAANKPVHGFGRTYGITGNLALVSYANLQDFACKQLTPGAGTVRTLTSSGADNIRLVRVTVDRNGDGTAGAHQVDAGVYIDGGSGHYFENVEVYGDDIGSGFALWNATDCELIGVHTHDINYLLGADPGNDRVQGIHIANCTRVTLRECRAHDIGGDFGGGYTLRWSRGYCFSGNTDFQVLECRARLVDQGYDTTGGGGNSRFQFGDSFAIECMTWGFKFANTARDGQVANCTAERCGLSGFVVSGPTGAGMTSVASSDIQFTDCVSYDSGYATFPGGVVAGNKVGFRVMNGTFDLETTLGVRFVGCKAHDRQGSPTMAYGFMNDVAVNSDGRYNEAVDCVSVGHTTAAFNGMHRSRCEVSRGAVLSVADNTWTAVDWTADVDYGEMHSTSSNKDSVFARRAGVYQSRWGAVFALHNTGQRGVRIVRNGVVIPGTTVLTQACVTGLTALQTAWTSIMDEGDNLKIEVFQDSGGNLDLQTTSGGVVEQVA